MCQENRLFLLFGGDTLLVAQRFFRYIYEQSATGVLPGFRIGYPVV